MARDPVSAFRISKTASPISWSPGLTGCRSNCRTSLVMTRAVDCLRPTVRFSHPAIRQIRRRRRPARTFVASTECSPTASSGRSICTFRRIRNPVICTSWSTIPTSQSRCQTPCPSSKIWASLCSRNAPTRCYWRTNDHSGFRTSTSCTKVAAPSTSRPRTHDLKSASWRFSTARPKMTASIG